MERAQDEESMESKPVVLFLCTGNSARSQMAEGLLRTKAGAAFEARSAGTEPAPAVHPLAVGVMREIGVDISAQRPKAVKELLGRLPVRHLIVVCDGANKKCPRVFPGMLTRDFWQIEDPAAFDGSENDALRKFREARDEISSRLDAWLAERASRSIFRGSWYIRNS
jgi:arsenate reductase